VGWRGGEERMGAARHAAMAQCAGGHEKYYCLFPLDRGTAWKF